MALHLGASDDMDESKTTRGTGRGRGRPRGSGRGTASRVQAPREVQNVAAVPAAPELIARRNRRHVEELERSNYADAKPGGDTGTGLSGNRTRTTLADQGNKGRKKATNNVRTILLYRKNLATIIEQAGLGSLPRDVASYVTAAAPESTIAPRMLCSVCSYWGNHVVYGHDWDAKRMGQISAVTTSTKTPDTAQDYGDAGPDDIMERGLQRDRATGPVPQLQRPEDHNGWRSYVPRLLSDLYAAPTCRTPHALSYRRQTVRVSDVWRPIRAKVGAPPLTPFICSFNSFSSDLLSRHVNKCHTPGGLANTSSRKNQGSRAAAAAAEDKKRKPCEACTLQSTKCDYGKPCNNCSSRGSKCAYTKAKRPRRNTNPSPATTTGTLPDSNVSLSHESMPINSFGSYHDDLPPFNFNYPQDNSLALPHLFEPSLSVPNANSGSFMGSPEAPSLSFSAATSDSNDSSPWNGMDLMGLNNMPNGNFDNNIFHDPNAPSFTSAHKVQPMNSQFAYNLDHQPHPDHQLPLTALHQRPGSASTIHRHPIQHHQRHRSSPSLDGSQPLLNHALLRAQGQQYPAITPSRLYMHRGSISASDSGTDYESSGGRPSTAGEYPDFPSPMSLVSESGSTAGVGRSIDDMSLHDPGASTLLSMGPMMVPGIGMGTGLTPALESPSRPSMTQRQSTFGDLKAFWNECMENSNSNAGQNGNAENRSLSKMTSMPCLKTPLGDASATPRAAAQDPLSRLGAHNRALSGAAQTPRAASAAGSEGLEQYQSALNARPAPSLHMAPKMKAAAAKQEDKESNDHSFAAPFLPGSAQADAWRSLMSSSGGSYVADSGRPNYKRLPSQTLGPENSKRAHHGDGDDPVFTDEEEENSNADYKQAQQEWHRRMSLPVMGRSGATSTRLHQPMPVPASRPGGVLN